MTGRLSGGVWQSVRRCHRHRHAVRVANGEPRRGRRQRGRRRTPARGRRSRRPSRQVRLFRVRHRCSNRTVFSARPHPEAIHDTARGAHVFTQFDGQPRPPGTDQGRRDGRRNEFRDSREPRSTSCCGRWPTRGRTRASRPRSSAGRRSWRTWPSRASSYQRWSRARLFPAEGPLTVRAQLDRALVDARRQESTRPDSADATH